MTFKSYPLNWMICGMILTLAAPTLARSPDVLLSALQKELARSFKRLKKAEEIPLYYLGYEVYDTETYALTGVNGAVVSEMRHHYRMLDVDARLGSRRFDNTHQLKGLGAGGEPSGYAQTELSSEDDEAALRAGLWLSTDRSYKEAIGRYAKAKTNSAVTAREEDDSDDFSKEAPSRHYDKVSMPLIDSQFWQTRLKRLSGAFKAYPFIYDSNMSFSARAENRYLVNSEATSVVTGQSFVRMGYHIAGRTADGMDLERSRTYDAKNLSELPQDDAILRDMDESVKELAALLKAPVIDPFTGPAIMRSRAAGVYFHEILGHRLEGHRQKIETEGQTFTKMLGHPVVARFLSVYDDPTQEYHGRQFLRGFYRYDDEGVAARRVPLIENGILKNFLLSRAPIRHFSASNGHGRRSPGAQVTARMGNLIVSSAQSVPYSELKAALRTLVKSQNKPYGLVFADITGGFTMTARDGPQAFKVIPLLVYRVYPDGRPDEAVRGADIVGTPLTAFGKITAVADDADVFNGTCGAESGWVPVSAIAPSILISELEVEKKAKSSEKPPVLAPPLHDE